MNKSPEKRIKKLTVNGISILIIAMFILTCLFSENVQARGEIPNNLIEEKNSTINEIMLGAGQALTLTRTYTSGTDVINLSWNEVSENGKYNVYQSKQGEESKLIATIQGNSVTLNQNNAEIKDEAAPTMPTIVATQSADGLGNNISITPSIDNGTTYRHYVSTKMVTEIEERKPNWTTPGTYTWKVPEGATRLLVAVAGGGGGGSLASGTALAEGGTGGTSSIEGYIEATGGIGGYNNTVPGSHHSGVFGESKISGGIGGTPNGQDGKYGYDWNENHCYFLSPGLGWELGYSGVRVQATRDSYGKGYGEGGVARHKWNVGGVWIGAATGGSGGYDSKYISVTPGEILTINVGAGGKGAMVMNAGGGGACEIGDGQDGFVLIAYGGNICTVIQESPSNTTSTTVTSGIKGYQYAITTSSTHTFTNEPIVPISEIPTYISGEDQMVQYLHIRAVDNSGLASSTNSILLQVPAKITLKSNYEYGMNYVPLEWKINDKRPGYVYRLYQRAEGQEKFTQIASSNSKTVIAKQETIVKSYTTSGGPYTWTVPKGVTSIKVTVAGAGGGAGGCVKYHYTAGDRDRDVYADVRGGNGGQGELIEKQINVKEGEKYTIKIGKAGTTGSRNYLFEYTAASAYAGNGSNGQSSSFGSIIAKGRRRRNWRKSNRQ